MTKIEKALNDIYKQIDFFLFSDECKNSSLSIQTDTAEQIISRGWVKSRVDDIFSEGKFSPNDHNSFFEKFVANEYIEDIGNIEFSFPDDGNKIFAGQLITALKANIIRMYLNLKISEYLTKVKNQK